MSTAHEERPRLEIARSAFETIIRLLSAAAVVFQLAAIAFFWPDLPDSLPLHFDLSGSADSWGGRWVLWIPLIVSLVFFVLLTFLERYPHAYNYLVPITTTNAERQYRLARTVLSTVKTVLLLQLAYLELGIINVGLGEWEGIGAWHVPIILGLLAVVLSVYVILSRKAR